MVNIKIKDWTTIILILLCMYWISGCKPVAPDTTPSITVNYVLTPYWTRTPIPPSVTPSPLSTSANLLSLIQSPTPTPILYTVVEGDTFTSIAFKHGVKLNDLISVNPEINPNFLSIGVTITIPITGTSSYNLLAPTPIPLALYEPDCYPVSDGGMWCLVKVENRQDFDVENVSARIHLYTSDLLTTTSQVAISPLILVPKGKTTLVASYFPPPLPAGLLSWVELISVIPVAPDSQRFLPLELNNYKIEFSMDKGQAALTGDLSLIQGDQTAERIWVLAIAYDEVGNPIAFRKWESKKPLKSGEFSHFDLVVSSLGPPIYHIDLLYEARP